MGSGKLCLVCAWREDCKKKFRISKQTAEINCPDFVRDLTIPEEGDGQEKKFVSSLKELKS